MFGLDIALLVGGAIITESVFNLQGLGWLAINGALNQDLPTRRRRDDAHGDGRRADEPRRRRRSTRSSTRGCGTADGRRASSCSTSAGSPCASRRRTVSSRPSPTSPSRCTRGETLGIVGESGSGKSVSNLAIMGLLNRDRAQVTGRGRCSTARDLLALPPNELRKMRGKDIAMVFQDPFACLHPMYRVGDQIAEAVRAHARRLARRRRCDAGGRAARRASASRTPQRARATTRTSSRAACASAR